MSKFIYSCSFAALLTLLVSGCSKDDPARLQIPVEIAFDIPNESNTFETHYRYLHSIPNFIKARLELENIAIEDVTSIQAGRGQLIPLSGNIDYRIYNDITITAISVNNSELIGEMYYNEFVDLDHTGNLELLSSISELRDIMIEGVFDLEIAYNLRQANVFNTEHRLTFNLAIFTD